VFGDYLDQAKKAGLRIHETPNAACHWVVLQGQTDTDREGLLPHVPRGGRRSGRPQEPRQRAQGSARAELGGQQEDDRQRALEGHGLRGAVLYWYYPFHKGFKTDWKVPPYDPERAKKLLAETGHAGGFEVRMNPLVMTYALDGPTWSRAVALDWEKIGIKVRRVPEAFSNFLPKNRARKTNKTHWVYGSPPFDEPVLGWQRAIHSKGAFNILCDGVYDEDVDTTSRELDADKRARIAAGARPEDVRRLPRRDARDALAHVGGQQEGQRLADARLRTAREQLRICELIQGGPS
jgi:ABC-type transport system substrate-binding protein